MFAPLSIGFGMIWISVGKSLYFPFIFPLILMRLPVPATEKHPHSMMLPPPCFTVGMVSGFLQTWCLAFRPKSYVLVSSGQKMLFLKVSPLRAFWQTPSRLSCAFYWGVLYRWSSFWKVLPSPQRNSGALSEWPSGSWSPLWPRLFSLIA